MLWIGSWMQCRLSVSRVETGSVNWQQPNDELSGLEQQASKLLSVIQSVCTDHLHASIKASLVAFWNIPAITICSWKKPWTTAEKIPIYNSWPTGTFSPYLYNRVYSELTCCNSRMWLVHVTLEWTHPARHVYFTLQRSWIMLVRPLYTVDNTRDYARVSHSRQWSNYNVHSLFLIIFILVANKIYKYFWSLAFWWALKLKSTWCHTVKLWT